MVDLRSKLHDFMRMNFLLWGRPRSGLLELTSAEVIDEVEERVERLLKYRLESIFYQTDKMVIADLTKK